MRTSGLRIVFYLRLPTHGGSMPTNVSRKKSERFSDGMICHSYVCSYLKTNRLLCTVNITRAAKRSNGGGRFTVAIG